MDLSITVNGMKFPNPFVLGSGPPGTNARVLAKSFDAGWGGAVAKTVSLESAKVVNVVPRYGKLRSRSTGEVIGFENIELISDRPIDVWLDEFRQVKKEYPNNILIASIMEEYEKSRWQELTRMVQDTGVDGFELNFSCPHGMTERKMGSEMGEHPDLTEEVTSWVTEVAKIPVWAKMTPNITNIREPALAAMRAAPMGISAINTILSVIGVDLDTLRPMPTVEGHSVPGGYSAQAVQADCVAHGQSTRARACRRKFRSAASAASRTRTTRSSSCCSALDRSDLHRRDAAGREDGRRVEGRRGEVHDRQRLQLGSGDRRQESSATSQRTWTWCRR